jgi:tRNA dimethylallyltransferase
MEGLIVNADALQVYDTLRVLTARPDDAALGEVEHALYGTVPASIRFSTGQWLGAVRAIIDDAEAPLIFVGGTGLYFDALLKGFADVPEVDADLVRAVEDEITGLDPSERLRLLQREDPVAAARLGVVDPQRLIRALAVKRSTGRTLSSFQDDPQAGLLDGWSVERMVLDPDRDILRERIARRFRTMFDDGAVAEVQALRAQDLDPGLPVLKAIGVREIGAWLDGMASKDEAIAQATIATQQYAKRQRTWFRNRFGDWPRR